MVPWQGATAFPSVIRLPHLPTHSYASFSLLPLNLSSLVASKDWPCAYLLRQSAAMKSPLPPSIASSFSCIPSAVTCIRSQLEVSSSSVLSPSCYHYLCIPLRASSTHNLVKPALSLKSTSTMTKHNHKSSGVDRPDQKTNESPLEAQSRKEANFADIESKLPQRFTKSEMSFIDKGTSTELCHDEIQFDANVARDRLAWDSQPF